MLQAYDKYKTTFQCILVIHHMTHFHSNHTLRLQKCQLEILNLAWN